MKKLYVIDTNVLLSDPLAILKFEDQDVVIPLVVLEELDAQKNSNRGINRDARAAIRTINETIKEDDCFHAGVDLPEGGKLFVKQNIKITEDDEDLYLTPDNNDNHIINVALSIQMSNSFYEVILVSNDINMRLKAKGIGLQHTQEYRNDIVIDDPDLLPQGFIELPEGWLNTLGKDDIISKSCGVTHIRKDIIEALLGEEERIAINDWLVNEEDGIMARLEGSDYQDDQEYMVFRFENWDHMMARKCVGISPKDMYQAMAIDALLDPDIDIVVMDGDAGSGKTLLAMAAATEMIKGRKKSYRMEEVIFSRSNDTSFHEIGFLKGGETEKMAPWLAGCTDNMEIIAKASKNKKLHPSIAIKKEEVENDDAYISYKALTFMRGRSINHKVFILDESQNLTASQMKTVLSRAGEYCKVIVMGNLAQIDNDLVSPRTSGLTYATEKLYGQPFAKVLCLQEIQRSRLAAFVAEEF